MREALSVKIAQRLDELLEVVSAYWLAQGSCTGNVVKQLAAKDRLLSDVRNSLLLPVWLLHFSSLLELVVLDDVLVRQLHRRVDLILEVLNCNRIVD